MLCAVLMSQMTEPYSRIGLTSEHVTLRGDANLNSFVILCLIKPNILRDLQQTFSICLLRLSLGQKTKPRSVVDLSIDS